MAYQEKIAQRHVSDGLELARFASLSNYGTNLEALVEFLPLLLAVYP
jgi:hypothetical protein